MSPLDAFSLTAGACAVLFLWLSLMVVRQRLSTRVGLGHGEEYGPLHRACRAHGNFTETAPLSLILILGVALQTDHVWLAGGPGALLVLGRVLHAAGLSRSGGATWPRQAGTLLTWLAMLVSGGYLVGRAVAAGLG